MRRKSDTTQMTLAHSVEQGCKKKTVGRHVPSWVTSLLLSFFVLVGCSTSTLEVDRYKVDEIYRVMVVPKGQTHDFWQGVRAGVEAYSDDAATEGVGLEIYWEGPLHENDVEEQIRIVKSCVRRSVDGVLLAPLDRQMLVGPVEEVSEAGIPVVIIDSGLDSDTFVSFVATDNRKGGELAGQKLGELLGGRGKVIMLRYQKGSASTHNREEGFLEVIGSQYPDVEVISADVYGGATRGSCRLAALGLLRRMGDTVQGIFCPNEPTTLGMLLALEELEMIDDFQFVGFDATDRLARSLAEGKLQALVVQDPFEIGYAGMRAMVDHLQRKSVQKRIKTGVSLSSPERVDAPAS